MAGGGEGTVLGYGQTEAGAGALDQSGSWRRFPDSAAYVTSMAQVGSRTLAQVDALLLLGEVDALRSGSGRRRWTRCCSSGKAPKHQTLILSVGREEMAREELGKQKRTSF